MHGPERSKLNSSRTLVLKSKRAGELAAAHMDHTVTKLRHGIKLSLSPQAAYLYVHNQLCTLNVKMCSAATRGQHHPLQTTMLPRHASNGLTCALFEILEACMEPARSEGAASASTTDAEHQNDAGAPGCVEPPDGASQRSCFAARIPDTLAACKAQWHRKAAALGGD